MKLTITLFITSLLFAVTIRANDCSTAYQDATYGLQHVKTAMEANNVTQLKEYAERSKEAIQRVFASTETCGCTAANDASYDALDNLDRAMEKEKFEEVRFYVSRAKNLSKEIMVSLDVCKSNETTISIDDAASNLAAKEKSLQEQQRLLEEEQQKLAKQIEAQKALQVSLQKQKEEMLAAQKALKMNAESSLSSLEQIILNFTKELGCEVATSITNEPYKRSALELEGESLTTTKIFYANKASEMASYLINTIQDCEWKK